ncbi:hypothetical protein IFM89_014040 [Coptis chinensis]|uniref:Retrotransposon gag domain-containing protein n=1 Tax=Coptis chinensis TaxID=261450 RepID=A0A835I279_9MAGN|nr:hypothetical protein IFM89_014040 [Coptis chinensis]
MAPPKFKHRRRVPRRLTTTNRKVYEDSESSESESQQENVYEEEREEGGRRYKDSSVGYSDSEIGTNTQRNQYYSPDESEYVPESVAADQVASIPSVTGSRDRLQRSTPTLSTYVNVAPLPIFRGSPEECPVTHLSRFAKVCRANNAHSTDMMMRIFPVTLENEAALWYDIEIEPYPSLTWDEIKSSFLNVYGRTELMMIKQGENETVHNFFLRMQWILRTWPDHGISDDVQKGIFIDGLREDFHDWIHPQKPKSLDEAFRLASVLEQAKCIRAARNRKNNNDMIGNSKSSSSLKCEFCNGPHKEAMCDVKEKMRELWFRIKEKQMKTTTTTSSPEAADNINVALKKDNSVRSASVATRSNDGEEEVEFSGLNKKTQCQCSKHQCWKKKLERNKSLIISRDSREE